MREREYDDIIRNKLQDHLSDVPPGMWERVDPGKKKDRRRGLFWIWPWALLLCLLAGGFGYFERLGRYTSKGKEPASTLRFVSIDSNHRLSPQRGPATGQLASGQLASDRGPAERRPTDRQPGNQNANASPATSLAHPQGHNNGAPAQENTPMSMNYPTAPKSSTADHSYRPVQALVLSNQNPDLKIAMPHSDPISSSMKVIRPWTSTAPENLWSLEVFVAPFLPINDVRSADPALTQALEHDNQPMHVSFSAGAAVARSFGPHFLAKIGIEYTEMTAGLAYHDSIIMNGNIHISSLDLPVLIGYQVGNDFKLTPMAGAVFNLKTWYKGFPVYSYGSDYKKNTGISLYLGVDFSGRLNDHYALFAEPYFQYHLSWMTDGNVPYSQRIQALGLNLGARYFFMRGKDMPCPNPKGSKRH